LVVKEEGQSQEERRGEEKNNNIREPVSRCGLGKGQAMANAEQYCTVS